MMGKSDNHEIPGELLSAWCDGELSLEEQARVEQLLHESPAARREAEEIAQLSELLKSLPRESAPPELISATLRRCEREMLLGTAGGQAAGSATAAAANGPAAGTRPAAAQAAAAVTAQSPQQPATGSRRSFFRSTAFAVTGLSLSLLFVVTVAWQMGSDAGSGLNSQGENFALTDTEYTNTTSPASSTSLNHAGEEGWLEREETAASDDLVASRAMEAAPEPAAGSFAADTRSGVGRMAVRDEVGSPADFDRPLRADGLEAATPRTASRERLATRRPGPIADVPWQEMQAGDIVRVLDREDGQIAVVELTVVNVSQSLGELQILLSRQEIGQLNGEAGKQEAGELAGRVPSAENRRATERAPAGNTVNSVTSRSLGNGIAAVFVQSTPEQLTRVIQGMQREQQFADLQLASAVSPDVVELASSFPADKAGGSGERAAEQLTVADLDRSLLESAENETDFRRAMRKSGSATGAGSAAARGTPAATSAPSAGESQDSLPNPLRKPSAPRPAAPAAIAGASQKKDARSRRPVEAPKLPGRGVEEFIVGNQPDGERDTAEGRIGGSAPATPQSFQMAASVSEKRLKRLQQSQMRHRRAATGEGARVAKSAPAATPSAAGNPVATREMKRQQAEASDLRNSDQLAEKELQSTGSPAARSEVAGKTVRPVRVLFVVRTREAAGS